MAITNDFEAIQTARQNLGQSVGPPSVSTLTASFRQKLNRAIAAKIGAMTTEYIAVPALHEILDSLLPGTSKDT